MRTIPRSRFVGTRGLFFKIMLKSPSQGSLLPISYTNGKMHVHQNFFPMKKHTVFAILLAFVASTTTQAQSIAGEETIQKVRQAAEQHLDIFNSRDDDRGRESCDCKKCQKGKKAKKHQGCNQRGNHYGKHKNHHDKNSCCCENRKKRDCHDDDDRRCNRDDDHRGYGSNGRDRDENDRRYEENRRDRNSGSNSQTRAGQKTSTAKVKTRPTPTAKPTSAPTSAKKRATSRPTNGR